MQRFRRKLRVIFPDTGLILNPGGFSTAQLRVTIKAEKTISGEANSFEVKIWGLTEAHRNALGRELETIRVEGGYTPPDSPEGPLAVIAEGSIREYSHSRSGPDIITTIKGGDGDKAIREAVVSETLPKGATLFEAIEAIFTVLAPLGVKRGEWRLPNPDKVFDRPRTMVGSAVRELNVLGRGNKFYWSIQNGTLEIIPGDSFLAGTLLITPDTGMVGTPTIKDTGVEVTTLLDPAARPNRLMRVTSDVLRLNNAETEYRISKVSIDADNQEDRFVMTCVGESITSDVVDEGEITRNRETYQEPEE